MTNLEKKNLIIHPNITKKKSVNKKIKNIKKIMKNYNSSIKKNSNLLDNRIKKPKILIQNKPYYPKLAKIYRINGLVTVMFDVNNNGKVKNIKILSSYPRNVFENSVILAIRNWTYEANCETKDMIVNFKFNCID